jgi:hypothetical protein
MPFGHERMDLINELVIEFAEQFDDGGLGFFREFGDFDVQIQLGQFGYLFGHLFLHML